MEKHFESFLQDCLDRGHTQIKLVPRFHESTGKIAFYAIGQCGPVSSETFEAVVAGDFIGTAEEVAGLVEYDPRAIAVMDLSDSELEDIALSEAGVADTGAAMDAEEVE